MNSPKLEDCTLLGQMLKTRKNGIIQLSFEVYENNKQFWIRVKHLREKTRTRYDIHWKGPFEELDKLEKELNPKDLHLTREGKVLAEEFHS